MAVGLHISISAEKVFSIAGLDITNSMLTSLIVSGLLIAFAVIVNASLKKTDRPTGLQNFAEWLVESINGLMLSVTGSEERTRLFFPLFTTFFLFILLNNWLGLFPGVGTIGFNEKSESEHVQLLESKVSVTTPEAPQAYAATAEDDHAPTLDIQDPAAQPTVTNGEAHLEETNHIEDEEHAAEGEHTKYVPYLRAGTADLNTTIALATISVFMTQVFGVMYLQLGYFKKFFNFSGPIPFFVGILELILELAKIISFAFRLFGNIFAGEVLLAVISFLVPLVVPMPFYGLEVVVGVIQALVFSMLSLVFFNMATISHDEH